MNYTRMRWLKGPPRRPGYYWFQLYNKTNNTAITPTLRLTIVDWSCSCKEHTKQCELTTMAGPVNSLRRRWAGPLPQPDLFEQPDALLRTTRIAD